ncbi:hypothetical protein ACQWFT_24930, partial [Salmonella enterica subsp. enterica serovar Infantis]
RLTPSPIKTPTNNQTSNNTKKTFPSKRNNNPERKSPPSRTKRRNFPYPPSSRPDYINRPESINQKALNNLANLMIIQP